MILFRPTGDDGNIAGSAISANGFCDAQVPSASRLGNFQGAFLFASTQILGLFRSLMLNVARGRSERSDRELPADSAGTASQGRWFSRR
jgi:hypothetical protein